MRTIKISFPQICIEHRLIDVTDEQFEELTQHSGDTEKADFIWSEMTEEEQCCTNGKQFVEAAIDVGYCGISSP